MTVEPSYEDPHISEVDAGLPNTVTRRRMVNGQLPPGPPSAHGYCMAEGCNWELIEGEASYCAACKSKFVCPICVPDTTAPVTLQKYCSGKCMAKAKALRFEESKIWAREEMKRKAATAGITTAFKCVEGHELKAAYFPVLPALLVRRETVVLRLKKLMQVVGYRGWGKSWLMETWALLIQAGSGYEALGFRAPASRNVLFVDGEMASQDVQQRFVMLSESLGIPLTDKLRIVAADWQDEPMARLDGPEGQARILEHTEWSEVLFLDNRSCLFDPAGEKDPDVWSNGAQPWLLQQRRNGKAVIWAHHANRLGTSRGLSKPEDLIDLELTLKRPEDYTPVDGCRFTTDWTKVRSSWGPGFEPFQAQLKDGLWEEVSTTDVEDGSVEKKVLDFVALKRRLEEKVTSSNAVFTGIGGNRKSVLNAVSRLVEADKLKKHPDGGFDIA